MKTRIIGAILAIVLAVAGPWSSPVTCAAQTPAPPTAPNSCRSTL